MSSRGWAALPSVLMVVAGCGGKSEREEPLATTPESASGACTSATASSGFITQGFSRQGGGFYVAFAATPTAAPSDALAGVTLGTADEYADLAAIVRFNPSGFIDARNGDIYAASSSIPYVAGVTRQIYMGIDTIQRKYTVYVDGQELARDFSFRTDQANALSLDGLALKVDAGGSLEVCDLQVQTTFACNSAAPGQGFVNTNRPASSVAFTVSFYGIPRAANMDGVMGISAGPATSFADLAGAVRFGPNGTIDARNGSSYSVLDPRGYTQDGFYSFIMVADVLDHTYSVVSTQSGLVAKNLSFRPEQGSAASLGNFAQVSDSAAGVLTVCELRGGGAKGAAWVHDADRYGAGAYSLAVSNERLLLSDDTRTRVLDAAGAVTREIPYGGTSVTDAQGNLYLLGKFEGTYDGGTGPVEPTAGGGSVYISKYDADFNPIYTRVTGTTPDVTFASPSADDQGEVAFVLRDNFGSTSAAVKLNPDGETRFSTEYPVTAVALDASGNALVGIDDLDSITVSKLDASGGSVWSRTFPTQGADLSGVVFDSLGNAAFWGRIDGTIDFGGTTFTARSSEDGTQGLFGALGPDGSPRWVRTTTMHRVKRAIADHSGNIIVVGTSVNPDRWDLDRFDADGTLTDEFTGDELLPGLFLGSSGDVALDAVGAAHWQVFPRSGGAGFNYLVKLLPF
jgi:hypothetical protein